MSGRIRLYRHLQQHHIRLEEPFSRGQAWVDLLMFASHEGGSFRVRGNKVIVKRGEFAIAETTLAMRRKRSREKVRKFLNELESGGMIRQQKNRICSKYIILNYNKYQTTDYTTEQTTEKQQTRQQKNILKNVKNVKECKEESRAKKFAPPSLLEIEEYCRIRGNKVDPERFIAFYESKGWMVGKNKMKDWKACVRTREGRDKEKEPQTDAEHAELYLRIGRERYKAKYGASQARKMEKYTL